MIDLDQIKNEWSALKIENSTLHQKNIELTHRLVTERVCTNQQRLAKNYRMGYAGFGFPLLAYLMYMVIGTPVWLCVVYSLFGIVIGCYDVWYMRFVKQTDYTSVPTVEAINHASKVVIYQNRATIYSIIGTLALLAAMFYEIFIISGEEVLLGGIVGAIVGGIFGTIKCIQNHRLARRMLDEIKTLDN